MMMNRIFNNGNSATLSPQSSSSSIILLYFLFLIFTFNTFGTAQYIPEQIRLAYTGTPNMVTVTWTTPNKTIPLGDAYIPLVQYGTSSPSSLEYNTSGTSDYYIAWNISSPFLHFANMTGLPLNAVLVYYRVGSVRYGWSSVYAFRTVPGPSTWPINVAVTGDMGIVSSNTTMKRLATMSMEGQLTFSIHNGDLAYADDRQQYNNGSWADGVLNDFYTMLSSTYSTGLPLMFGVGNHEMQLGDIPTCINGTEQCKGLAYIKRIGPTLPYWSSGSSSPYWYSYNVGPVHFLSISMEQTWDKNSVQYNWIVADLASIDRSITPWVVAYVHRPLYCSNNMSWPSWNDYRSTYEPLFNGPQGGKKGGVPVVDVVMTAHVHCYERLWQVASNGTWIKKSYNGMNTPLYLLSGSAGCIEGSTPWIQPQPAWSAYRACENVAFGFVTLSFVNATTLRTAFIDANNGNEIDTAWVYKYPQPS